MRPNLILQALLLLALLTLPASQLHAATQLFFSMINSGGGQHNNPAPTPVSGTMTALIPRFNGGLGTLIQADLEFAGDTNGSWTAAPGFTGTISFNLSGPVDADGEAMGPLVVGFNNQPIGDQVPGTYSDVNFVNSTWTSGTFFNSLTGVGNVTVSWVYSGSSSVSVPAIGEFDWGGTAHMLYTYVPIPEPSTVILAGLGAVGLVTIRRRRRSRAIA